MGNGDSAADKTIDTASGLQGVETSHLFENAKNIIADKLHHVAAAIDEKAAEQGPLCDMAKYGKQASAWLDQSAEYVRQFNYEHADAKIREYVRQSPGRSVVMAGAVGIIIGVILRRR